MYKYHCLWKKPIIEVFWLLLLLFRFKQINYFFLWLFWASSNQETTMFSAIFGNIFYGQAATATTETNTSNEVSTQTFDNKTIATQVNLDTSKHNNSNLNDTSTSQQLDWVIVDEESQNTNDKACSVNNVEMTEEVAPTSLPSMERDDVLIGSFFRKNEADEGERYIHVK